MTDKLREQSIKFAKKHLFECAKEILEWGRTSILCDGKLRELAKTCEAWVRDKSYALGVAEAIVKDEALRAALAQQDAQAVVQGWKLVPVAPTPEMRKAAADAWIDCGDRLILNKAAAALRAGIAAAPTPPARATLTASEILNMTPESIPAEHDGALLEYARDIIEAYERKNGIK